MVTETELLAFSHVGGVEDFLILASCVSPPAFLTISKTRQRSSCNFTKNLLAFEDCSYMHVSSLTHKYHLPKAWSSTIVKYTITHHQVTKIALCQKVQLFFSARSPNILIHVYLRTTYTYMVSRFYSKGNRPETSL